MRVRIPGHAYDLANVGTGDDYTQWGSQTIYYIQKKPLHDDVPGVTCQEVLRTVVDRVHFLDAEEPHEVNDQIEHHLRMAIGLFEARAMMRKITKGKLKPELVEVDKADGHFPIKETER